MQKDIISLYSSALDKQMDVAVYGHYGFALLLFPALSDSSLVYEANGTIDKLEHFIKKGKCRVFVTPTVNDESWLNNEMSCEEKSKRHFEFNTYISDELVPEIYGKCGGPVPIIASGASIGAYHAANSYFRRPDLFYGLVSLSGFFNIEFISKGYFDENCYFNSPVHYLPNLNDSYWLSFLMSKHHVYLYAGRGENEHPHNSMDMCRLLTEKTIPHHCDIWGEEYGHNFESWNEMLYHILNTKL